MPGSPDRGGTELGAPFFLSYGRTRKGESQAAAKYFPDQQVKQFYSDLAVNISQLIVPPIGVPLGFMDQTMRSGVDWGEELLHALGTCQVLVALLSQKYLTSSEWCGKEWNAFEKREIHRLNQRTSPRQGCIIPVVWAPYPEESLPSQISADMIFSPGDQPDPGLPDLYQTHGIMGLMRMNQETSYQITVWQLAMDIRDVYYGQYVKFRKFKPTDLRNVFGGGGDE